MGLFPKAITEYLAISGIPVGPSSKIFFVDAATGSDSNPGTNLKAPLATIAAAYALCTTNQNDTVVVLGAASSNTLSAALTWAKNYTHLVGWCAPTMVAQRARIFQLSTLAGASPLLTISGSGCIFKNFYIFQGVDDATSLINVSVTGDRNYFENVHFAGGGHATQAINGGASLQLNGGDENTFINCTIGVDTVAAATGMVGILFDGDASRNIFRGCHVSMLAGHTGAAFVEVTDGTGIDRYTIFDNCIFSNTNQANFSMASAFVIPAVAANRPARIFLKDCMLYGNAKLDASDRGVLMGNMNAVTASDTSGLAVEMVV